MDHTRVRGVEADQRAPAGGPSVRIRSPGRRPQLDGLRGLAVLAVILNHFGPPIFERIGIGASVYGFFVLSGFLITGILLRARAQAEQAGTGIGPALRAFYVRRGLRIFPAYYLVLMVTALLGVPQVLHGLAWYLSYLANWHFAALGHWDGPVSHLWSLSIEEQFYLCWPLMVLMVPRNWLPRIFVATVVLGPLSRAALYAWGVNDLAAVLATSSTLDSLGLGACLAFLWEHESRSTELRRRARVAALVGIAVLSLLTWSASLVGVDWPARLTLNRLTVALGFFWMVDRGAEGFEGRAKRFLEWGPLVYLGTISYGIYLYHNFVPPFVSRAQHAFGVDLHMPGRGGLQFVYVTAVTIALAALSWHGFEGPVNDLKRRFPYSRRDKAQVEALAA